MTNSKLIRISDYFNISRDKFDELGILNSLIYYDVPMYVNPRLLNNSNIPELKNGEEKIIKHFETTIKMLWKTNRHDKLWEALKIHFSFKEPSGIGLGTSINSTDGRGLTGTIAENCLNTLKEIIDLGFKDPEIYKLLFLVQENIGVDRISDMICRILYEDLLLYTHNMIEKLGIKNYYEKKGIKRLKRPNGKDLVFIPSSILSDMPDVIDPSDIIECSSCNAEVKEYLCEYFEKAYVNVTDINNTTSEDIKNCILGSKILIQELLKLSKTKKIENYDFSKDEFALFGRMDSIIDIVSSHGEIFNDKFNDIKSLNDLCNSLLSIYKFCIENLGINEEFYSDNGKNKIRREQVSHKLFIMVLETAKLFTKYNYFYESKTGNGQIEFVVCNDQEKILMEFKLTTNDLVHGYDKQLPEYIKRHRSTYSYYVIIDVTGGYKIKNFYKNKTKNHSNCSIFEIDATIKPSPSKL